MENHSSKLSPRMFPFKNQSQTQTIGFSDGQANMSGSNFNVKVQDFGGHSRRKALQLLKTPLEVRKNTVKGFGFSTEIHLNPLAIAHSPQGSHYPTSYDLNSDMPQP